MSRIHISCVIICLLYEWKFTAIACFSVQKEVSMSHLGRYSFLISSAWNPFSGKFVMMFSQMSFPMGKRRDISYSPYPSSGIVKRHLWQMWRYRSADSKWRYLFLMASCQIPCHLDVKYFLLQKVGTKEPLHLRIGYPDDKKAYVLNGMRKDIVHMAPLLAMNTKIVLLSLSKERLLPLKFIRSEHGRICQCFC